ncbi:hypothetical protein RhiirC2_793947 [Rhizophagus irregularis]|uniref:Uncharacterized protein n=1 Tax=Rhizophagus irregularis TaxID=588596 RepID=A0A2N1MEI4_9GLOM|nr:hypothetical protein RhiirC2_793947 [Rhizophagus irregularis]
MLENELVDFQQKNFKFEQNIQNLRLNLAIQIKESAEKENVLQTQIIDLQNEKQSLIDNLTKQLEQNKQTNQQVQIQVSQLKQEKFDLQEKLIQTEVNIQQLKSKQKSLSEQKEQLENKLEQIKMQLTQALQIKDNKINELEKKLVTLDQERIKQLKDKEEELSNIEKELLNKLTSGEDTKEIHKEKEAKRKEMNELQQELSRTSASYDANRKKQILNQVNNFLKVKGDFLNLREKAIKKLHNCCNHLESSINKERNTISSIRDIKTTKLTDKYTKEFQINVLTNFGALNTKKRCNKRARLILIKLKDGNKIIRGYNPLSWKDSSKYLSTNDSLFSHFKSTLNPSSTIPSRVKNKKVSLVMVAFEYLIKIVDLKNTKIALLKITISKLKDCEVVRKIHDT